MKFTMIVVAAVLALFTLELCEAAQAQGQLNGKVLRLRTNTEGGECSFTDLGGGLGTDVDCDDGAGNRAYANTVDGCLLVTDMGQCIWDALFPIDTDATEDVACPGGKTFTISTGDGDSNSSCTTSKSGGGNVTGGHCGKQIGEEETNTADVDCSCNGGQGCCDGTTGSGSCTAKP